MASIKIKGKSYVVEVTYGTFEKLEKELLCGSASQTFNRLGNPGFEDIKTIMRVVLEEKQEIPASLINEIQATKGWMIGPWAVILNELLREMKFMQGEGDEAEREGEEKENPTS